MVVMTVYIDWHTRVTKTFKMYPFSKATESRNIQSLSVQSEIHVQDQITLINTIVQSYCTI